MILEALAVLSLAYLGWSVVSLEINYRRASSMGIPLVRLIIDPTNLAWMIVESHLWPILDRLPIGLGSLSRYGRRGWNFADKASSHVQYGPILAVDESVKQTRQMLNTWADASIPHIRSVARDMRTLSLNVLAATGFRRSYDFVSANKSPTDTTGMPIQLNADTKDTAASYRDALQTVLDNCIMLMIMPRWVLSLSFAPEAWQRVGSAAASFKGHMARMLDEETSALKKGSSGSGGLMTSFVRAMDLKQHEDAKGSSSGKGLSLEENFGNIFVINFAGHDTTANTLAFATLLLAAHPHVQE